LLVGMKTSSGGGGGTVNHPTNSATNPTSVITTQESGSKLLVSMAAGAAAGPTTSVSSSGGQSGGSSRVATGDVPSISSKSVGSKPPRQAAVSSGSKGQAHSASGRSSGARGFPIGHSKGSCQVTSSSSGSGQSNPALGLNSRGGGDSKHHHHIKNSKSAKSKGGGGAHHPTITVLDRKTRQKSSK
jgi:hypothetical protein